MKEEDPFEIILGCRQYHRLQVHTHISATVYMLEKKSGLSEFYVSDICANGIGGWLRKTEPVKVSDKLQLIFPFSQVDETCNLKRYGIDDFYLYTGRVVYILPDKEDSEVNKIGLEFIDLLEEPQKKLDNWIRIRIMEKLYDNSMISRKSRTKKEHIQPLQASEQIKAEVEDRFGFFRLSLSRG